MDRIKTDICIIGAGSGGLSVAAGAVQMGANVVLIEAHKMGGDCLNYGCVPSKALLAASKMQPVPEFAAAKDYVQQVIDTIAPVDSQDRFEGLGVNVIRARARFISKSQVQAGESIITARRFVVATGSGPLIPPIPGINDVAVHTNETIFELRQKPRHLLIIGGGPIGMEMAQAHLRLGCKVTVIEAARAMGKDDPELAALLLAQLRAEGTRIVEQAKAERISGIDGEITVHTTKGDFTGSHLLMAVGRKVNLDGLDLDKAGVVFDGKGVKVGPDLRSLTNRRVYAIGDAAGGAQFTHVAGYHAGVIIRSMLFALPSKQRTDHIPWATYTDPELAQVGLTEAEARAAHGNALTVVRWPFRDNDRAVTEGRTAGLVKVIVVRGRPVGAGIAGSQAGELIALWALAISARLKMSAVAGAVLPYPTLAESGKRAAGAYFSPKLFANPWVRRVVGAVQRWLP